MKGSVLDFDVTRGVGLVAGDDGARYEFPGMEWKAQGLPTAGTRVDFVGSDGHATGVYRDLNAAQATAGTTNVVDAALGRSRIVAALLAIFLGMFGIHRFYLGQTTMGVIYIVAGIATIGFGFIVTAIIGFIEGILFLVMSDAEFQRRYPPVIQSAFAPTLRVPPEGIQSWTRPNANGPATALAGGLELVEVNRTGDWAQVRASNGWTGWVDRRRLTSLAK
jgi:TM2 domain-containing membrane protein YozV